MGLFDSLMKSAGNAIKADAVKAASDAASSVGKGSNHTESFTFSSLPNSLAELQAMPEASLDSAFKTTALTIAVLCAYEKNPDGCIEMLNFLKGPAEVSTYEKGFIKERLNGKFYKTFSFFEGATPENSYKPNTPYTIKVSEILFVAPIAELRLKEPATQNVCVSSVLLSAKNRVTEPDIAVN